MCRCACKLYRLLHQFGYVTAYLQTCFVYLQRTACIYLDVKKISDQLFGWRQGYSFYVTQRTGSNPFVKGIENSVHLVKNYLQKIYLKLFRCVRKLLIVRNKKEGLLYFGRIAAVVYCIEFCTRRGEIILKNSACMPQPF